MTKIINLLLARIGKKITFLNYSDMSKNEILEEFFSELAEEFKK